MIEEWRDVPEFNGKYKISNYGNIKSKFKILKTKPAGKINKYASINLCFNKARYKSIKLHRTIAKLFLPDFTDSLTVNHKDGNKNNNKIDNLEMKTQLDNNLHKYTVIENKKRWGIYRFKGRWRAMIRTGLQKKILIGSYADQEEAYIAYANKYTETYGVTPW